MLRNSSYPLTFLRFSNRLLLLLIIVKYLKYWFREEMAAEMEQLKISYASMTREQIDDILGMSWERGYLAGVEADKKKFDFCSDEEYQESKKDSYVLYIFCNRLLKNIAEKSKDQNIGFGFFDQKGRLMQLYYGNPLFKEWIVKHGIDKKTVWTETSIGTNAVALGLRHGTPFLTQTKEHYCKLLRDSFVGFAPCIVNSSINSSEETCLGGVAVFGPENSNAYENLLIVDSLSKELSLYISASNGLSTWEFGLPGVLAVDLTMESKLILHMNESAAKILGSHHEKLRLKKLNKLFDPLPENADFWDIVDQAKVVKDFHTTVSIKGVKKQLVISTTCENQDYQGYAIIIIRFKQDDRNSAPPVKRDNSHVAFTFDDILVTSPSLVDTVKQAMRISNSESNVLIVGESGAGKDVFAQAIHNNSSRRDAPFIAVNCATIPHDLIASELFGYEYGAFSGSKRDGNKGKFELANTGTLFLDEIGDMPFNLQAALLRVVEEKRFIKLGGSKPLNVDVRIICATNSNLKQKIENNLFREDLYYRISTLSLRIPALRERKTDIPVLANFFVSSICARMNIPAKQLSPEVMSLLIRLPWRGNVRELKNLLESVLQMQHENEIQTAHIVNEIETRNWGMRQSSRALEEILSDSSSASEPLIIYNNTEISKAYLMDVLARTKNNKTKAAQELGVSRKTLYKWLNRFDFE